MVPYPDWSKSVLIREICGTLPTAVSAHDRIGRFPFQIRA